MNIEFSDLVYKVHNSYFYSKDSQTLLKSINGKFLSNQLTAIIGASGAGKSTLLNILSGYKIETNSELLGNISIDGKSLKKLQFSSKYKNSICFIAQEDVLSNHLSVNESMTIAASLKLSKSINQNEKQSIIDDILSNISLYDQKSTMTFNLSGGQKKRLSIALELINNPAVLFLDEPTTGLDNVSAKNCLKIFKKLSKQNHTLICTIHQPSASIFHLFDNVYVLAQGRCVYYGDTQLIVKFLNSIQISCPIYYNPADLIIEVTNGDDLSLIEKCSLAIKNGRNDEYVKTEIQDLIFENNMKIIEEMNSISLSNKSRGSKIYARTYIDQFGILLRKMMQQIFRNKTVFYIQLFHHLICAITVGLVFFSIGDDGIQVFNHIKFCMGTVLFFTYTQIMIPVVIFPEEIELVKKENFNKWYHLLPYYCALTVSKLPLQIFFNYIFITITYIMVGFPLESKRFLLFSLVGNLISFTSESLGLIIGSIFNVTKGCVVGPAIILPFLGFLVYGFDFMTQIPYVYRFLINLTFMRCGSNTLFLILFGLDRKMLECSEEFCLFRQPKQVIQFLSIDDFTIAQQIYYLLLFLLICRLFVYFVLKFRFNN